MERKDTAGTVGVIATYTGRITANNKISGTVTWSLQGAAAPYASGTWSGDMTMPTVAAAKPAQSTEVPFATVQPLSHEIPIPDVETLQNPLLPRPAVTSPSIGNSQQIPARQTVPSQVGSPSVPSPANGHQEPSLDACDPGNPKHLGPEQAAAKAHEFLKANNRDAYACWLSIAASEGKAEAQLEFAKYLSDTGDLVHAAYFLGESARQGNVEAEDLYAQVWLTGRGVPKKNEQLAQLMMSHPKAYPPVQPCDTNNPTHANVDEALKKGLVALSEDKKDEAECWLIISGAQGGARAMFIRGFLKLNAGDYKDPMKQMMLRTPGLNGLMNADGDASLIFSLAQKSARQDDICGQVLLIITYHIGIGTKADQQIVYTMSHKVSERPGGDDLLNAYFVPQATGEMNALFGAVANASSAQDIRDRHSHYAYVRGEGYKKVYDDPGILDQMILDRLSKWEYQPMPFRLPGCVSFSPAP